MCDVTFVTDVVSRESVKIERTSGHLLRVVSELALQQTCTRVFP